MNFLKRIDFNKKNTICYLEKFTDLCSHELENIYIKHVNNCLHNAENNISKISQEIKNMEGMTGEKTRHFYNNLLSFYDSRYLEIGTWKGSSVCSAMYGNNAKVICIDNWLLFNGPKDDFMSNLNKFRGINDVSFIEKDCFEIDISTLPKINIYMYDGDHEYRDQYNALKYYYDCLDDIFIFVVDDWNHEPVRNGTRDAIKDLNIKILFEKEIFVDLDKSKSSMWEQPIARETWWNGMYVAVLKK